VLRCVTNLSKFRPVNRSLSPIIFDISIFSGEKFSALKMAATLVFIYALHGVPSQTTVPLLVLPLVANAIHFFDIYTFLCNELTCTKVSDWRLNVFHST